MNDVITRDSLLSLEAYAKARPAMRTKVLEEKQLRRVFLGEHILLLFENELLIRYQIQEMLRVEKTYEEEGIQAELEAYNPLVSGGSNLKATMQIEYIDEVERARMLVKMKGIERRVWMSVAGFDPVFAIADEDMSRENDEKTAAVHFLRFAFSAPMIAALKDGKSLAVGVDHEDYHAAIGGLAEPVRLSLVADLK